MTMTTELLGVRLRGLAATIACACLCVAAFGAGTARATYGDHFGLAAAEGAIPGTYAFWAGTCDLTAAPAPGTPIAGGFGQRPLESPVQNGFPPFVPPTLGPTPAVPRDCIDTGVTNYAPAQASAWGTAPAWRLPAVTQAGAHPDATALITMARDTANESSQAGVVPAPAASARDIKVRLPVGFAGNPGAIPYCSNTDFESSPPQCPASTQVGVSELRLNLLGNAVLFDLVPVYNLEPTPGHTAEFGMPALGNITSLRIAAKARTDEDNGVTVGVERIPTGLPMLQQSVTLWGVPWDSSHDPYRFKPGSEPLQKGQIAPIGLPEAERAEYDPSWGPIQPFTSNPTSCDGSEPVTRLETDSWQHVGDWLDFDSPSPPVTGCDKVGFDPELKLRPQSSAADSPSAYDVDLSTPQNNDPPPAVATDPDPLTGAPAYWKTDAGLATSHLKSTTVTLPAGIQVNAAAGDGLAGCSQQQIGLTSLTPLRFDNSAPSCPDGARIGSVEVETPLLQETLKGVVYLAEQKKNPFGSLIALYLVVRDTERDLTVKLAGKSELNPVSGQITATFTENPQLPFEHIRLHFRGGARAPLANPRSCGTFATASVIGPWSGNQPASVADQLTLDRGPGAGACPSGALQPQMSAGLVNPRAGTSSPLLTRVTRADGSGRLDGLTVKLPQGLTAYLRGVPYCPEGAIALAATHAGRAERVAPSCPAASRIGSVTVGAGVGPAPLYVGGAAYLAGPYKGAPLSLAIVTPAVAGPFDLGTVVVRAALRVDPVTTQITAVSDPIPTILEGIPLNVRDIRVNVDRPGFTLAPTSCDPQAVEAAVHGAGGGVAPLSDRFQVGGCSDLPLKPRLDLKVSGGTRRSAYQKLRTVLKARPGDANLGRVSVALPHSLFLAQEHIRTVCTRPQFAADACPAASVYGWARAETPLLDAALEGPVYLRSSDNELPDLVAALDGQVEIELVGRIDSVNGGIRTTFDFVPDAPVSRFVLSMKGGKRSLLVNSRNLCAQTNRATVRIDGQNGKTADHRPKVRNDCGKVKAGTKKAAG